MNKNINGFHAICRKYFIGILNDFKKQLRPIAESVLEIHEETKNWQDDRIKNLYGEFSKQNPLWYIRKEILEVILLKIESIVPKEFHALDDIKNCIIIICKNASINRRVQFSKVSNETITNICDTEKEKFYCYIETISEKELYNVEPLFYRRTMHKKIARNIEEAIREKWQDFYVDDDNILCICVRKEHFNKEVDIVKLIDRLKYHKIKRIYEINTGSINFSHEMDLDVFDPSYRPDGVDLYWCSNRMDWAIKEDHDGYCYFVGKWLIEELRELQPNINMFYTSNRRTLIKKSLP